MALQELAALEREITAKSAIVRAVEWVAKHLGNTAAVANAVSIQRFSKALSMVRCCGRWRTRHKPI